MCCSCWLSIVIWSWILNKIYTFSSSFIIASDQLCNSEGCFVPASLCILEPLGSQHDWSWKKLLKVHIMIGLYHVKSFQDKQSNNQQSVIIMHCDCCDRQESGIICLVWVVITFYCTLKVDKTTGTSGDVFDLGTEAAPFQMHPGKAPRKGLKLAKVPAAEIPQKKESRWKCFEINMCSRFQSRFHKSDESDVSHLPRLFSIPSFSWLVSLDCIHEESYLSGCISQRGCYDIMSIEMKSRDSTHTHSSTSV